MDDPCGRTGPGPIFSISEVGAGRGGVNQLGSAGPPAVGPRRYVRLLNHRSAEVGHTEASR